MILPIKTLSIWRGTSNPRGHEPSCRTHSLRQTKGRSLCGGNIDSAGRTMDGNAALHHRVTKTLRAKKMVYQIERERGIIYEAYTEHRRSGPFNATSSHTRQHNQRASGLSTRYHHLYQPRPPSLPPPGQPERSSSRKGCLHRAPSSDMYQRFPTPLGIYPFALFPQYNRKALGCDIPRTRRSANLLGFFSRSGGYFWAINDGFTSDHNGGPLLSGAFRHQHRCLHVQTAL